MKKRLLAVLVAMMGVMVGLGAPAWAATPTDTGTWNNCSGVDSSAKDESMCSDITDSSKNISKTVKGIFGRIFGIAGVLGVVGVIYGGFAMMTAGGDPTKVKKSKDTLLYSVVGIVVVALSWAIISFVVDNLIK